MEEINIAKCADTPGVRLSKSKGVFEIIGVSYPEDVRIFYGPILQWLADYNEQPNDKTVFVFKLDYFNTATSKILLDVMMSLEKIHKEGHECLVEWHFEIGDEDLQESGVDYSEIVKVPFKQMPYEEEGGDEDFLKGIINN
jgi:hypothetical protein